MSGQGKRRCQPSTEGGAYKLVALTALILCYYEDKINTNVCVLWPTM